MKKVFVIVGPTAVGKTSLSVELAKRYNAEIISGDSVQVYKGLNIGSAKIKPEEMKGVIHHLIDILKPNETYDVSKFQIHARSLIEKIDRPLIVGGTGLYIKACLDDYDFSGKGRSLAFESRYDNYTNEALHEILLVKDKETAEKIHPNNRRRVLRALSFADDIKRSDRKNKDKPLYDYEIFYLTLPREILYERINERVDEMIKEGLVEEVKTLKEKGYIFNIIGYREINEYLDGLYTLEEAISEIKKVTRRFAKRQETFFKNQMKAKIIYNDSDAFNKITEEMDGYWK